MVLKNEVGIRGSCQMLEFFWSHTYVLASLLKKLFFPVDFFTTMYIFFGHH